MKVALSTDWIYGRDHGIEMLDMLAELYREAPLYTLAFKENSILGPVVERPIHSTFLSHKADSINDIFKWTFSLPSLAKGLFIPCSTDVIVNITRGLSQGIKKCDKTPLYSYVYDLFWLHQKPKGIKQKIFWSQMISFGIKEFKKAKKVWSANAIIQAELSKHGIESEILEPFFKVEEFPLFPENVFKREVVLIQPATLSDDELEQLLVNMEGEKVRLLGEARASFDPALFIGNPCAGELAPIFASSKVLFDFEKSLFPKNSLAMLSCGGPVISDDESKKIYLDSEGVQFKSRQEILKMKDFGFNDLKNDPKKLHAHANRFHGTRFKRKIETTIQSK